MAGKILIVDDVATNRILLKVRLASAFHETLLAADGCGALRAVREERPDVVLLDLQLPDMDGLAVLGSLRGEAATRDLPVIVHTASTAPAARAAAFAAGADDVFTKPFDDALLMARIRNLLRRRDPAGDDGTAQLSFQEPAPPFDWPGLIAVTGFPPGMGQRLRQSLSPGLSHRLHLANREETLGPAPDGDGFQPDAYLVNATEPESESGLRLLSELRAAGASRHAGIAVLTSGPSTAAMAYDLGADEAMPATTAPPEMALRLSRMVARGRIASHRRTLLRDNLRLAMTDPLTGLHNRRYAMRRMGEMSVEAAHDGGSLAVLIADIDRFKQVNDAFGHGAGDHVITEVARRLAAHLPEDGLIARIGGEEFLIAFTARPRQDTLATARRLCAVIDGRPIGLGDGHEVTVTISIGLACVQPGTLPDEAMALADRGLMAAKLQGRNRVIVGRSAA